MLGDELKRLHIDLNMDAGESLTHADWLRELALYPYVSSINIACGFHAGDAHVMSQSVAAAVSHGLAIGAHPGLPDRDSFGRLPMALTAREIYELLLVQIGALDTFVRLAGATLRHVKPHGALYHMANRDAEIAEAVTAAMATYDPNMLLFAPFDSLMIDAANKKGLRVVREAFADRGYGDDGQLLARATDGAMIDVPQRAAEQALALVQHGVVTAISGIRIPMPADTICIHGDHPHAPALLTAVREHLVKHGVTIAAPRR